MLLEDVYRDARSDLVSRGRAKPGSPTFLPSLQGGVHKLRLALGRVTPGRKLTKVGSRDPAVLGCCQVPYIQADL